MNAALPDDLHLIARERPAPGAVHIIGHPNLATALCGLYTLVACRDHFTLRPGWHMLHMRSVPRGRALCVRCFTRYNQKGT